MVVMDESMWAEQVYTIVRLYHACRRNRLEFLLEVIPSKVGKLADDTTALVIQRFYDAILRGKTRFKR